MWKKKQSDKLHLEIKYNNKGDGIYHKEEEWEYELSYQSYREAVLQESIRLLKLYGLGGYNRNWCDGNDIFPVNSFLMLLGSITEYDEKNEVSYSDIFSEIKLLERMLSR